MKIEFHCIYGETKLYYVVTIDYREVATAKTKNDAAMLVRALECYFNQGKE